MSKPFYDVETYDPQSSVGYLIKRCGTLMGAAAERAFEGQALSFTQIVVLIRLKTSKTPMSATVLNECLGHDPGALTRVIDGLERTGLLTRERSALDRRVVALHLTDKGRVEAEKALTYLVGLLNQLLEVFEPEEVEALISLLQRLQKRLQENVDCPQETHE